MPPYIKIRHREIRDAMDAGITVKFSINYFLDASRHDSRLQITVAVLGALSVVWAIVLTYR